MKKKNFKFLLLFSVLICALMLAGCEKTSSQIEAENQKVIQDKNIEDIAEYTQNYFAVTMKSATYEQFEQFLESGQHLISIPFDNDWAVRWKLFTDTHGAVKEANVDLTERTHEGNYTSRIILTGEDDQMMALTIEYDKSLTPIATSISDYADDSKETLGSKMATAGSNTLTGLIVVFAILIGLSLIISCFKFVAKIGESKPQNKDDSAGTEKEIAKPAPKERAAAPVEIPVDQNEELCAVIAAAIAAYEDKPAEGYVVRSIRRLKSNKWS